MGNNIIWFIWTLIYITNSYYKPFHEQTKHVPLYLKSKMPRIAMSKTSEEFQRIKHFEIIEIKHEQFHKIDNTEPPIYPMNGFVQFDAFGRTYKLWGRKHMELFGDNYHIRYHENGKLVIKNRTKADICHYQAEVLSDPYRPTRAIFSVRKGRGFHGFIHAFNETITVKPLNHLIKTRFYGKFHHSLKDLYIAWKYTDVDRSDYPHTKGATCAHSNEKTKELHERELYSLTNITTKNDKIIKQINWLKERIHDLEHEHRLDHHNHEHNINKDENIIIKDDYNYEMDVMANPFSKHANELKKNAYRRALLNDIKKYGKNNRRYLQSTTTRYVELLIVNDPGRVDKFKSLFGTVNNIWRDRLEDDTIEITNNCNDLYVKTDWGTTVGAIQLSLQSIEFWIDWSTQYEGRLVQYRPSSLNPTTGATLCVSGAGGCDPDLYTGDPTSEVDFASYLSRFQVWRESSDAPAHDNAQLYSHYDFYQSVIGYASLPGMCRPSLSGGIEQCTYGSLYNANIVAHEMGHNFNMAHDSVGNSCSQTAFIMAAVGSPYGNVPDEFSSCSVANVQTLWNTYSMTCVNNVPTESIYATCGNGLVEEGESCDCGKADCSNDDACCNGATCNLYNNAKCSSNDACCDPITCSFLPSGTVCNVLDTENSCDIQAETCDGVSAECPPDFREIEGTYCQPALETTADDDGMCYNGVCVSTHDQCYYIALANTGNWVACAKLTSSNILQCNLNNVCQNTVQSVDPGTPCAENPSFQWINGQCRESSTQYTSRWITYAWSECSIKCKDAANDPAGNQTRTVVCAKQNGDPITGCDDALKPSEFRLCNDVVCNFCEIGVNGVTICGSNGMCLSAQKACQCDPGYSGIYCDVTPTVDWLGIVRHVYLNGTYDVNGLPVFIADRTNPCGYSYERYDPIGAVLTRSLGIGTNISTVYIGSSVYLRWNTTGDFGSLAVGLQKVDAQGNNLLTSVGLWAFYVGTGIATDNQNCDIYSGNASVIDPNNDTSSLDGNTYDPCYVLNACDDYHFVIPTTIETGFYKILVRFNNDFNLESDVITIECYDPFCNQAEHGTCNVTDGTCACDSNYFGDDCTQYTASDWNFQATGSSSDAFSATIDYNRCFDTSNSYNDDPIITNIDDLCTCSNHFMGTYCETPIDYCGQQPNPTQCAGISECIYSNNQCIYADCAAYTNQNDCQTMLDSNGATVARTIISNGSYPIYCEWVNNLYCNRVTCPTTIDTCNNGALRRPLQDDISICATDNTDNYVFWYCDCNTMTDIVDSFWKISDPNDISITRISSDVTCNTCLLNCENDSTQIEGECYECINCDPNGIYEGPQCNNLYWIISIRINNIPWEQAAGYNSEIFNVLIVKDMAYFLGYPERQIFVEEVRQDGTGIIVYFRTVFDSYTEDGAQQIGGDIVVLARENVNLQGSPAYRGFLMNNTDSSFGFIWCIPGKEECDPNNSVNIMLIFWICLGSAFVIEVLLILLYRFLTRKQRQERYETKVREVRAAQLKLMEHHEKARRVGMRDVSKKRAKKIHNAKERQRRESELEMRRQSDLEKDKHRQSRTIQHSNQHVYPALDGLNAVNEHEHESIPNTNITDLPLPDHWQKFENDDGIPYFYNTQTGETSWIHPLQH